MKDNDNNELCEFFLKSTKYYKKNFNSLYND